MAEVKTVLDAILMIGRKLHPTFNLEDPVRLAMYQRAYETIVASPPRGLLINGSLGVGKSTMMQVVQILFKDTERRFKWVTARELKLMVEEYKPLEICEMYGRDLKADLYIDDIGVGMLEQQKKYGNTVNIISELLFERYELFVAEGYLTHLSCNLPLSVSPEFRVQNPATITIKDLYGDRLLDRILEQCNIMTWAGKSLRRIAL